mmetsp:Transcript_2768/g.3357  ORF Transcript_2768/g.3357 Transcript_2768/m.3357 type:complete len:122 (-) Transcript_2768:192-557(-)
MAFGLFLDPSACLGTKACLLLASLVMLLRGLRGLPPLGNVRLFLIVGEAAPSAPQPIPIIGRSSAFDCLLTLEGKLLPACTNSADGPIHGKVGAVAALPLRRLASGDIAPPCNAVGEGASS